MSANKKDFHGLTVKEAILEFYSIVGNLSFSDDNLFELITGQGPVQDSLIKEIVKLDLNYFVPSYNLGKIIII